MLQVSRADVVSSPFPHVVKQGILPQSLFDRLKADFPDESIFRDQDAQSNSSGSRVGKGTGFDIYRGDVAYDRLVANSVAWKELDDYINSAEFVQTFVDLFADDLSYLGLSIEIEPTRYDRNLVEGREVLTDKVTLKERLGKMLGTLRPKTASAPTLFSRLDIEKGMHGYAKPPHCDRSNRLCSLIIYFTDTEAEGISGGELNIYALNNEKAPKDHVRHPRSDDVNIVATLRPKANLGVFFPCSNNSYHGVNAMETSGRSRDFLYINISADVPDCW